LEVQIRDAMQGDGGLAGAGATLNHDDAARRLRDEIELLFVDQRGDLGQAFVGAHRGAVMNAELAFDGGRGRRGARGFAHAAVKHGRERADRFDPAARRVLQERALRRADAAQVALRNRDIAARFDDAIDAAAGDLFFVVVAFFVAVVDARDRRVSPIDDLHVRRPIDEAALADHHVAALLLLAQPHMREVRRRDVDRQRAAAAESRLERREPRHLFDQRRQIFGARFGDLVAQGEQVDVEVTRADLRLAFVFFAERDASLDLAVEALLFRDDVRAEAVLLDQVAHKAVGDSNRIAHRRKM
jgi:hypothetical protein